MQRYIKRGYAITVDVSDPRTGTDYIIRADIAKTGGKDSDEYIVMFEIQAEGYSHFEAIPNSEVVIHSRNINLDVCDYIEDKAEKGGYYSAMDDYYYHLWCLYQGDLYFRNIASEDGE